jgi:gliding motility-associated lipoprotein GldD
MRFSIFFLVVTFFFTACEDPIYTPKPRGFPKVVYPQKAYQPFTEGYCNFTFDYPKYAVVEQDLSFFDEKPAHPCWFDLYVPSFDSRIYCSYLPIDQENTFEKLKQDAFKMTDWHNKKATYIDEFPIQKRNGVKGMLFKVEGPAASPLQFFLTDSLNEKHFLRGALYFNTQARPDSLAPVLEFVKKDVEKMLDTFEWTD